MVHTTGWEILVSFKKRAFSQLHKAVCFTCNHQFSYTQGVSLTVLSSASTIRLLGNCIAIFLPFYCHSISSILQICGKLEYYVCYAICQFLLSWIISLLTYLRIWFKAEIFYFAWFLQQGVGTSGSSTVLLTEVLKKVRLWKVAKLAKLSLHKINDCSEASWWKSWTHICYHLICQ